MFFKICYLLFCHITFSIYIFMRPKLKQLEEPQPQSSHYHYHNKYNKQFNINCSMIISKATTHKTAKKRSVSIQHTQQNIGKAQQKIMIMLDETGFIIENSTLLMGLQCECECLINILSRRVSTNFSNTYKQSQNLISAPSCKKLKIHINLDKTHLYIQKNSVQHIFPLPQHINNHLKVVLNQNYEICNFAIINKKLKIINLKAKNTTSLQFDQIRPLELVQETDRLRKINLLSKGSGHSGNICWNQEKISNINSKKKTIEELEFDNQLKLKSSVIFQDVFPRSQTLTSRMNINLKASLCEIQVDQTKDSERISSTYIQPKTNKNLNLKFNLDLWSGKRKKSQYQEEFTQTLLINSPIRKSLPVNH